MGKSRLYKKLIEKTWNEYIQVIISQMMGMPTGSKEKRGRVGFIEKRNTGKAKAQMLVPKVERVLKEKFISEYIWFKKQKYKRRMINYREAVKDKGVQKTIDLMKFFDNRPKHKTEIEEEEKRENDDGSITESRSSSSESESESSGSLRSSKGDPLKLKRLLNVPRLFEVPDYLELFTFLKENLKLPSILENIEKREKANILNFFKDIK